MSSDGPQTQEPEINALQDFGADVVAELFGAPEDPPNTLLWLANIVWDGAAAAIGLMSDYRRHRLRL